MPAKYVDSGPFMGCGVVFPNKQPPGNKDQYRLYKMGFKAGPLKQYMAKRSRENKEAIARFILEYNREHFPQNTPDEMGFTNELKEFVNKEIQLT